jgi:hypothetical protein
MGVVAVLALAGCGSSHRAPRAQAPCPGHLTQYGCQVHSATFGLPPSNPALRPPKLPPSAVPTASMLDTVNTDAFSGLNPQAVAGYTAGFWKTYFPEVRLYPRLNAIGRVVSINIAAGYRGRCLDIEPGDATPSQAAGWVRADFSAGFDRPCIYTSLAFWPSVRANLAAAGLHQCSNATATHCVLEWDADWTFTDHLDAGFNCTQWTDHYLGRNIDASRCELTFFRRATPTPAPKPDWNGNFVGGFQRGFTVGYDRRRHRSLPANTFRATDTRAYNAGFQRGFTVGWQIR